MNHNLRDTVALLARTPATLDAWLRDLSDSWTCSNEGDDTWSPLAVVAHLIHAERTNWMPRLRLLLHGAGSETFAPFDRAAGIRARQGRPIGQLLGEFGGLRAANLDELRALNLEPADLERTKLHPALGVVTLAQLLATWAVHDLTHVHQISRVMASQYRDAVGPWIRYLGVLRCTGHSAR
jgi:DinB family protein